MKFNLIDRIDHLSDQRIVAVKYVSLAEEYLADHFPTFPVLPGVMMLEAMTQAAAWLLHLRLGFSRSMAVLKEARNVKYGHFVAPGRELRIEVEAAQWTDAGGLFKSAGHTDSKLAVSARLELACFNLADRNPALAHLDGSLRAHNHKRWSLIAPLADNRNVALAGGAQTAGLTTKST